MIVEPGCVIGSTIGNVGLSDPVPLRKPDVNGLTTGALEGTGAASEEGVAVLSPEMGVKPVGLVELLFL